MHYVLLSPFIGKVLTRLQGFLKLVDFVHACWGDVTCFCKPSKMSWGVLWRSWLIKMSSHPMPLVWVMWSGSHDLTQVFWIWSYHIYLLQYLVLSSFWRWVQYQKGRYVLDVNAIIVVSFQSHLSTRIILSILFLPFASMLQRLNALFFGT